MVVFSETLDLIVFLIIMILSGFFVSALAMKGIDYEYKAVHLVKGEQVGMS